MPERVALFGAAGFVGRAMTEALLDAGYAVRACDLDPSNWTDTTAHGRKRTESGLPPASSNLELAYGDISEHAVVASAMDGCVAAVHTTVFFPQFAPGDNTGQHSEEVLGKTWATNLKGLWNVLDVANTTGIRRVVHIGSCNTVYPGSTDHPKRGSLVMTQDVRRPDGSLYAIQKRLQEEMCRQFYEANGTRIVVLRPDGIMDLRTRSNRGGPVGEFKIGWICRHQLSACAVAAISAPVNFGVFHTTTIPNPPVPSEPDPRKVCNVSETEKELGVSLEADVRPPAAAGARL